MTPTLLEPATLFPDSGHFAFLCKKTDEYYPAEEIIAHWMNRARVLLGKWYR